MRLALIEEDCWHQWDDLASLPVLSAVPDELSLEDAAKELRARLACSGHLLEARPPYLVCVRCKEQRPRSQLLPWLLCGCRATVDHGSQQEDQLPCTAPPGAPPLAPEAPAPAARRAALDDSEAESLGGEGSGDCEVADR